MGLKVSNLSAVSYKLQSLANKVVPAGFTELVKGGESIGERAKEYAPVDHGNLEKAIRTRVNEGRKLVYVHVDGRVRGDDGRPVARYGVEMHEGYYNPGPKSQAKANATGKLVGRKFLERALDDLEDEVRASVEAAIGRAL